LLQGERNASETLLKKRGSLAVINPELSKQWHPQKNGTLTPNDITAGSSKKVWWVCEKGHEWEAVIKNRAKGIGCHYCYRIRQKGVDYQ